mgnify:CR=1 FL=1
MSNNTGGFEYEQKVLDCLKRSKISGDILSSAGSDSKNPDADFVVGGENYLLEIKKDDSAQMGGTSVKYSNGKFTLVSEHVDSLTQSALMAELNTKKTSIDKMLKSLNCTQFPLTCDRDSWTGAKNKGLLKPINGVVKRDLQFLIDHYKNKGVHYIQIGDSGLFYLDENPANLPIPKLEGELNIEIRAGRSGSYSVNSGAKMVSGGLRIQGRLKVKQSSPFTLDNLNSVKKMIKSL